MWLFVREGPSSARGVHALVPCASPSVSSQPAGLVDVQHERDQQDDQATDRVEEIALKTAEVSPWISGVSGHLLDGR